MNEKLRAEMEKANPFSSSIDAYHQRWDEGFTAAVTHLLPDLEEITTALEEALEIAHNIQRESYAENRVYVMHLFNAESHDARIQQISDAITLARKYLPKGKNNE